MTMPARQKLEMLEAASLVVQVAIDRVDAPEVGSGELADCTVTGRARRVFSGHWDQDAELSFKVTVYSQNPPPGDCYQDLGKLRQTPFVEAYLDRDGKSDTWGALDTGLVHELGNEPGLLVELRRAVAATAEVQEPPDNGRSGLRAFLSRLLGRI